MGRRELFAVSALLLRAAVPFALPGQAADGPVSAEARAVHEQLVRLSEGGDGLDELRIELFDSRGLSSHRSFLLEDGRLVGKAFPEPGAPMERTEGPVADARTRALLEELIDARYWTFEGTRFVPDAPVFLFRFYYEDLPYVDFRCDVGELERSPARVAIREILLRLVEETDMSAAPEP